MPSQNILSMVQDLNHEKIFLFFVNFFSKYILIVLFLKIENAARDYGVDDVELFQSVDLYEKRNISQVTHCIFALAREAQDKNFNGPVLNRKAPEARPLEFNERQLFARKSLTGLLDESLINFASKSEK